MKTPSVELFDLIRNLSKPEKRYFKLLTSLQKGDKEYQVLFDKVEAMQQYDEDKLKASLRGYKIASYIPKAKNYLYKLITQTLIQFHSQNSVEQIVRQNLSLIEILYKKGLYLQSQKILEKTTELAENHELYSMCIELSDWASKLWYRSLSTDKDSGSKKEEIFKRDEQWIHYAAEYNKFRKLSMDVIENTFKYGSARNESDKKKLMKSSIDLLKDTSSDLKESSVRIAYEIYRSYSHYYGKTPEHKKVIDYSDKSIRVLDANKQIKENEPYLYIAALGTKLDELLACDNDEEIQKCLLKLESFIASLPPHKKEETERIVFNLYIFITSYFIIKGDYHRFLQREKEIESSYFTMHGKVDSNQSCILASNIALNYFISQDFKRSLTWNNIVLNTPEKQVPARVFFLAKMLSPIIHFELKNYEYLHSVSLSTQRLLLKKNAHHRLESAFLSFFKSLIKLDSEKQVKERLKQLKEELMPLSVDPYESVDFIKFDYLSWVEGHISGERFSDVIKRKHSSRKKS